ncbi:MAG: hypothetical protein ABH827_00225 [bacterium]
MIRKILSTTLFTVLAVSSAAMASETRAPFISKDGPLRYDLYKKKNKCTFDMFSTGHYRTANKAFLKHGTDTHPLTSLIFGKSEFTLAEAFEDANPIKYFTENRSPYLATTKIAPRVSYTEYGATLGGRFEYPVWHNKGRVGLRATVPFKTVRMERDDNGEDAALGLQNAIIKGDATRMVATDGNPVVAPPTHQSPKAFENISRYKLQLLDNTLYLNDQGQIVPLLYLADGTVAVKGSGIHDFQFSGDNLNAETGNLISWVVIKGEPGKLPPFGAPTGVTVKPNPVTDSTQWEAQAGIVACGTDLWKAPYGALKALPTSGFESLEQNQGYVFLNDAAHNYTKINEDPNFNELWLSSVHLGSDTRPTKDGDIKIVDDLLNVYRYNVEEFMKDNAGFVMATNQRTGLGDIDLDAFYEHTFNNNWRGEVFAGLRLPTGGSDKMFNNPFTQQLGNSNHFEIKLGGNIGWAAFDWMNLKAEASYSFVLEDTEHRLAVFKGSKIKNFGPSVDADVDWGYFIGKIDATFYHPKTEDLATTIGYQIYYKTEETINFKKSFATNHALGKAWADAAGKLILKTNKDPLTNKGSQFVDYEMPLDNKLAEANTEAVAHRVFFESNWKANKYMNLYVGGTYTFAGQNMPRESDMHAGALVKF